MTILGSIDGVNAEASSMFASIDGAWVELPLGGGPCPNVGWVPRVSIPAAVDLQFTGEWVNNTTNIPPNFNWTIENDEDGEPCVRFRHDEFTMPANITPPYYEMRAPIPVADSQEMFNTQVTYDYRWVGNNPQFISFAYAPRADCAVVTNGTTLAIQGTQGSNPQPGPSPGEWVSGQQYQGSIPVAEVDPALHEYLLRFYPTYYSTYGSDLTYPVCDLRVRYSHFVVAGYVSA